MAEQIKTNRPYPIQVKLRDGRSAPIRVMQPADLDQIVEFAKQLPADDLLFLRTDITDRNVVKQWIDNIKNGHTITLLAEIDGELAAYASVHLDQARMDPAGRRNSNHHLAPFPRHRPRQAPGRRSIRSRALARA